MHIGQTGQVSVEDNAATVLSSPPKEAYNVADNSGYNPTFPRVLTQLHWRLSPTLVSHAICTRSLNCQQKRPRGNHRSGLLHYLSPEHITHMTITRRPKIGNDIWKKLNFGRRNSTLLKKQIWHHYYTLKCSNQQTTKSVQKHVDKSWDVKFDFSTRRHASAVCCSCVSFCLSQVGVLLIRLNTWSCKHCHR